MQYSVIENILKKKIGLDPSSIGSSSISRVIRRRFTESGYEDLDEYIKVLESSEQELRALIEAIVIPETWFFRDGRPFMLLGDYVKERWLPASKDDGRMLRILSVPCSTGEEPYSVAMILSDLDYPASRCQIDAVDISSAAIAHARRCIYKENSFRGDEMDFRHRYFEKENNVYKLDTKISERVNYFQGNLLGGESFPVKGPYHVIFCRNLLIYFDRSDQKRAIAALHKLLVSDGILFIGHAEAGQTLNEYFSPLKYRGAFAYRKSSSVEPLHNQRRKKRDKSRKQKPEKARVPGRVIAKPAMVKGRLPVADAIEQRLAQNTDGTGRLDHIRQLADEGRLGEASSLCEQYLHDHPDSAISYYLLGVLCDAKGDTKRAIEMFRKAIYLDPNHHEALIHLALHAERGGNKAASDNLKRRAQRAADRHKSSAK